MVDPLEFYKGRWGTIPSVSLPAIFFSPLKISPILKFYMKPPSPWCLYLWILCSSPEMLFLLNNYYSSFNTQVTSSMKTSLPCLGLVPSWMRAHSALLFGLFSLSQTCWYCAPGPLHLSFPLLLVMCSVWILLTCVDVSAKRSHL